jgi:hypothetical protein
MGLPVTVQTSEQPWLSLGLGAQMKAEFTTTVVKAEDSNATGLSVPPEIVTSFGSGKKPKVVVTVNGYSYRSTVAAYGDVYMLPLSAERRVAAGVKAGDIVEVVLELDTAPRTVEIPAELAVSLDAQPGARQAFEALSYTLRKEYVRQVEEAKAPETRERRIAKVLASLKK